MPRRLFLILVLLAGYAAPVYPGPWRAVENNVFGWQLMTPDERIEHQRRLRGFDAYEACSAYVAAHHAELQARADRAGLVLSPRRQSVCDQLRAEGRLK
ncbi:hypothetical protein CEW87_06015 [Parazoarcus communis]|jgi:hypothetical protein|uniref:Uncharacterized protein n=1 Tax=Parazoarcus communis TaxID=41977 RepID=A0A2U8GZ16_9RHOO|nr:hypothetical protein [Parazoarcus communis]AWI78957.1 hypothetical protein CEW87_06015 [Parazoarcus communis]